MSIVADKNDGVLVQQIAAHILEGMEIVQEGEGTTILVKDAEVRDLMMRVHRQLDLWSSTQEVFNDYVLRVIYEYLASGEYRFPRVWKEYIRWLEHYPFAIDYLDSVFRYGPCGFISALGLAYALFVNDVIGALKRECNDQHHQQQPC